MKLSHILLFGLSLLPVACNSSIPDAAPGGRISGVVRYDGQAHLALARPALEAIAAVAFPPPALPHGVLVIEKPDFSQGGIRYELANLPVYAFKVAAQIIDLGNPQTDPAQLPLGGYPDACTLMLVPDAGLVEVEEDAPVTGIDIQLFDGQGMSDPCFAALLGQP
jgi:hypothetical protein